VLLVAPGRKAGSVLEDLHSELLTSLEGRNRQPRVVAALDVFGESADHDRGISSSLPGGKIIRRLKIYCGMPVDCTAAFNLLHDGFAIISFTLRRLATAHVDFAVQRVPP